LLGLAFLLLLILIAVVAQPYPPPTAVGILSLTFAVSLLFSHLAFVSFLAVIGTALGRQRLVLGCVLYGVSFVVCAVADVLWGAFRSLPPSPYGRPAGLAARFPMQQDPVAALLSIFVLLAEVGLILWLVALTGAASRAMRRHVRLAQEHKGTDTSGIQAPAKPSVRDPWSA
jgi:hypothetical protein